MAGAAHGHDDVVVPHGVGAEGAASRLLERRKQLLGPVLCSNTKKITAEDTASVFNSRRVSVHHRGRKYYKKHKYGETTLTQRAGSCVA